MVQTSFYDPDDPPIVEAKIVEDYINNGEVHALNYDEETLLYNTAPRSPGTIVHTGFQQTDPLIDNAAEQQHQQQNQNQNQQQQQQQQTQERTTLPLTNGDEGGDDGDDGNTQQEGQQEQPSSLSSSSRKTGAGIAGGIIGLLLGGPIVGAIAGFGTAYAAGNMEGAWGDTARAVGDVALSARDKAQEVNRKHRLMDKGKKAANQTWEKARELNEKHGILENIGRITLNVFTTTMGIVQTLFNKLVSQNSSNSNSSYVQPS